MGGRGLFGFQLAGPVPALVDGRAWVRAMLEVEGALARAEADAGVIPHDAAKAIESVCRTAELDPEAIAADAAATGTPVVPFVGALGRAVADSFGEEAARFVHFGATSQDVIDSAAMLVAARSLDALLADLVAAADRAAALADEGRRQVMVARTWLQPALPTTFGFVAAGWLSGLDRAAERLARVRDETLAAQLGGAVGTLAAFGEAGPAVLRGFAAELGLAEPDLPWHTERSRVAELASALGAVAGVAGKIGLDVVLLTQGEIGEVRETGDGGSGGAAGSGPAAGSGRAGGNDARVGSGRGASSAMPQKHNPVAAIAARTCAARAIYLVPGLLAGMAQELQRGAGTWQAEWGGLSDLLAQTGSAVAWIRESLEGLHPDPERMRLNVEHAGPSLLSERIANALIPSLGRAGARRLVAGALERSAESGQGLERELAGDPEVAARISASDLAALLDPTTYLGSSERFIDRALRVHEAVAAGGGRRLPRAEGAGR